MNGWDAYRQAAAHLAEMPEEADADVERLAADQEQRTESVRASFEHEIEHTYEHKQKCNQLLSDGRDELRRVRGQVLIDRSEPLADAEIDPRLDIREATRRADVALDELRTAVSKQKSPSELAGDVAGGVGLLVAFATVVLVITLIVIQFI
ncbi:hypothetical protein CLV30_11872 [Haloactinopolyspora alba]|uniref:Uncharacterized protein n=1 Tax=Haloactinopolyspora alba TaxID=648780 RepID=A0A2P8DPQ4_9ACTN|nr:hypothetical protein [Haloactinopolyspora alba]PSK99171.1 hypothetical protein CLV30_11872 [Haloactinopolyspora alba]